MTKEDKIMIKGIFCTLMRAIIELPGGHTSGEIEREYYRMVDNLFVWIEKEKPIESINKPAQ